MRRIKKYKDIGNSCHSNVYLMYCIGLWLEAVCICLNVRGCMQTNMCILMVYRSILDDELQRSHGQFCKGTYQSIGLPVTSNQAHTAY